jgi:ribosomal protein S2
MKNHPTKVKVKNLIENFITIGKRVEELQKENLDAVFETTSGTVQINPSTSLKEIKKTLFLVTSAAAKGNQTTILLTNQKNKKWKNGLLSNFKELNKSTSKTKHFPVLVIVISSSTKQREAVDKEAITYGIPSIFFSNTNQKPLGLINVLSNNNNESSTKVILSLVQRAMNIGVLKTVLKLNPQIFPRLDSNQRPRT